MNIFYETIIKVNQDASTNFVISNTIVAVVDRVRTVESPPFRPHISDEAFTSPHLKSIINQCLAEKAEDRPNVKSVMADVKKLLK